MGVEPIPLDSAIERLYAFAVGCGSRRLKAPSWKRAVVNKSSHKSHKQDQQCATITLRIPARKGKGMRWESNPYFSIISGVFVCFCSGARG